MLGLWVIHVFSEQDHFGRIVIFCATLVHFWSLQAALGHYGSLGHFSPKLTKAVQTAEVAKSGSMGTKWLKRPKWAKAAQSGPNSLVVQSGQKWPKLPERPKVDKNGRIGPKWPKIMASPHSPHILVVLFFGTPQYISVQYLSFKPHGLKVGLIPFLFKIKGFLSKCALGPQQVCLRSCNSTHSFLNWGS